MTARATHILTAIAIAAMFCPGCETDTQPKPAPAAPAAAEPPPSIEPVDVPPAPAIEVPDASAAAPEPPPDPAPAAGPVRDPSVAILGAWRGVRFEGAGDQNAAGHKLARTMLLQFSPETMKVTLGPAGTVEGPWTAVDHKPDHLTVERATPAPAQRFEIAFQGRDVITMTVSSRQAVRFDRLVPSQGGQAPPTPEAPPSPPTK